ncbi:hypothetical protein QWI17_03035 [Gilvimarinus sp. SDUM040013]|uniref:Glycoside hydrolase family 65 n=1 Tax=Gilvimarinus gilvus TaxID=3058038 RepID=A0ABU4S143_9GAMM|nr:hypothetical protein [Gilvimarinus sp. SDUM040013]MDO3384809.1 hypothetical protein [Gilvimarinus sp. SDUM040013]MDX6850858.1 hypothetical protein [Gilvimarinus sp. SDUM040013]
MITIIKSLPASLSLVSAMSVLCGIPGGLTTMAAPDAGDPSTLPIDRHALVNRHNPINQSPDILSPFSLGNGEFAVTVDATGLQTFPNIYEQGIPLGTLSQWGWHSTPNVDGYQLSDTFERYNVDGRDISYAAKQHSDAGQWLRANPHRLHLGRVGFARRDKSIGVTDISAISQKLDMWQGTVNSQFELDGQLVTVKTAVHPERDQLTVTASSKLLQQQDLAVEFEFPYGTLSWGKKTADWQSPEKHTTEVVEQRAQGIILKRTLDATVYYVAIAWAGEVRWQKTDAHRYVLQGTAEELSFSVTYAPTKLLLVPADANRDFSVVKAHWQDFWLSGGAIDLSLSKDSRAHELERRIILSRYLTAIQTSGSLPPSETGLTCNSWYGKFHLEMHWWHGVHYALWNKPTLFEKSLAWYQEQLPQATAKAARQGYKGARWPKMVGPNAAESPSTIGVFLVWQQPHPIYFAELLYQLNGKSRESLEQYKEIVLATTEFMVDYLVWNEQTQVYDLAGPIIPAQEIYSADETHNPTFELAYWRYGLQLAQRWRNRLQLAPDEALNDRLQYLAPLPKFNNHYVNAGNALNTFEDASHLNDHPSVLGILGMLPGHDVDKSALNNSFTKIFASWNWQRTWGWDYPLVAMTAARLGRTEQAIDALLMQVPKNTYLNNGHNYQEDSLPIYLPGNGALLSAVAMMAAGWEGSPSRHAPGFPAAGWTVRVENINPLP